MFHVWVVASRSNSSSVTYSFTRVAHSIASAAFRSGLIPRVKDVRGGLQSNYCVRLAEFVDGSSNTLMITEDAGRPEFWIAQGRGPNSNNPGGGNLPVRGGRVRGGGWADPSNSIPLHTFTHNGLRAPGPCAINCTNNNEAYSFHSGGVQAVFGDGRVRLISEDINIATYAALITRAGREILGEF